MLFVANWYKKSTNWPIGFTLVSFWLVYERRSHLTPVHSERWHIFDSRMYELNNQPTKICWRWQTNLYIRHQMIAYQDLTPHLTPMCAHMTAFDAFIRHCRPCEPSIMRQNKFFMLKLKQDNSSKSTDRRGNIILLERTTYIICRY